MDTSDTTMQQAASHRPKIDQNRTILENEKLELVFYCFLIVGGGDGNAEFMEFGWLIDYFLLKPVS